MSATSERAVLASVLLSPDCIIDATEHGVVPEMFRHPDHRTVYTAMQRLASRRIAPDPSMVMDELERMQSTLGPSLVADLMSEDVTPPWFPSYRDALIRDARTQAAISACTQAIEEIRRDADADPTAILQRLATSLPQYGTVSGPVPFAAMAEQITERLDQQRAGTWQEQITPTGFPSLDRMLDGGFRPGELVVLAGRPGMAKTSLALALARNAARGGSAGLMYSLEMSGMSLFERALADASGREMSDIRSKHMSEDDHRLLTRITRMMATAPVYIDDTPGLTSEQAAARTRRFMADRACSLVLMDYLQIMGDDRQKGENDNNRVSRMSGSLKRLAMERQVPVVMLSQLNRSVETNKPPEPQLGHLRDSGAIEQDADIVLMLYRNDYYAERGLAEPDASRADTCDVFIRKQRNGSTGTVTLNFTPNTMSFTDPTDAPPAWQQEAAD